MPMIDEEGCVFGVVNIIDLLAVLFAVAVVVAGVALVFSDGPTQQEPELGTRYVTLDLGSQPAYVTERIDAGEVSTVPSGPDNLTITDVYVTSDGDGSPTVTVRARVNGQLADQSDQETPTFIFAGESLILGRQLTIETTEYRISGNVTAVQRTGESLPVSTTEVITESTLPADVAMDLSVGDHYRVSGRTLATIESKTVYPADSAFDRRVFLGLSLRTITRQSQPRFSGRVVRPGNELTLQFDPYEITGTVRESGRTSMRGEVTTTTVVLELTDVPPTRAANVQTGLTETIGQTQYAEITDVRSEPSEVVLTSDDGNISLREHPRNVDFRLTVDLRTRQRETGLTFHGEPVRLNDQVTLNFDYLTVRGVVIEITK
ncbi:DUF4330 family protein [Salinigranum sp. GCM10025319]|uniref:DUF4330 family protein n=1 Tax=Salinigranum sp. GCM10025319 TaxID=3252687 RepID=UPI00360A839D